MTTPLWTRRGVLTAAGLGAAGLGAGTVLAGCGLADDDHRSAPSPSPASDPVGTFALGLNVSGLEDPYPEGPTDAMLDAYAGHGIRRLRLPGSWKRLQPQLGGPLEEGYLAQYRAVVEAAAARGMSVVVEPCHNDFSGRDLLTPGGGGATPQQFADFWARMVAAFADQPAVTAWDLMNEPDQLGSNKDVADRDDRWRTAAQAAIDAIRGAGDTRTIKVEGTGFSSAAAWPTNNPTLHELRDPGEDLLFSAHCYLDRDNSGQHYYWDDEVRAGDRVSGGAMTRQVGVERLEPYVEWLRRHGVQGDIGECGAGRRDSRRKGETGDSGWQAALRTTLEYCRRNGLAFYYWGTGVHLNQDYGYSVEPEADGTPAPQWKVLEAYA